MFRITSFYLLGIITILLLSSPLSSWGISMDWSGRFGIDSTLIDTFRKLNKLTYSPNTDVGSQEVPLAPGDHANAAFQSYFFYLNPVIIVNDAASIKGEITTNYGRGGMLGDSSKQSKEGNFGNSLYNYNTSNDDDIIITKLYAEFYTDTATYLLGRHSSHWALGAVVNDGTNLWDRHTNTRDGITMKVKIGNFHIAPFWAKISSGADTRSALGDLTRSSNVEEYGFSLLYDNSERDLTFGLLYSKKNNNFTNSIIRSDINNAAANGNSFGRTDVKLIDLYLKKTFGRFNFAIEFPLVNGDIDNLYGDGTSSRYKAKATIIESSFQINNSWKVALNLGNVTGDTGNSSSYEAMYLHPNYQIANLMFRYNFRAVADKDKNIYDSYVTNAKFLKLIGELKTGKWAFDAAYIYALANTYARSGSKAHNHLTNKIFDAVATQSDKLGQEVDLGFNYFWNSEITIGGCLGYHFVGKYYAFSNDPNGENKVKNSYLLQLRTGITF